MVMMELRRLRYFLRIASEGSLGKASRSLGIAQPALGRHVQMLESELGVQLFDRISKGMRLTDEGEYLKEALEHPIDLVQTALRNVRSFATRVEASLVLGLPPEIAKIIGARLISRLRRDLPNLSLRVVEADSAILANEISRGLIDIAILIEIAPDEKIFHFPIIREAMLLVVPSSHDLAAQDHIAFGDLQGIPLILPGLQAGIRIKLEKLSLAEGRELQVALEIDSTELTKDAIRAEIGCGILPPLAFAAEARRGELVGIAITGPAMTQVTNWSVRPRWPVPRSTYTVIETGMFQEWMAAVSAGDWPAEWLFDVSQLGQVRPR